MAIWSAFIKSIEYHKPIYRVTIDVKKDGIVVGTEVVDIEDNIEVTQTDNRIKDVLRRYEQADSVGVNLNKKKGTEINLVEITKL